MTNTTLDKGRPFLNVPIVAVYGLSARRSPVRSSIVGRIISQLYVVMPEDSTRCRLNWYNYTSGTYVRLVPIYEVELFPGSIAAQ